MSARPNDPGIEVGAIVAAWNELWNHTHIGVIESPKEYDKMVKLMDSLVDEVGDDEKHKLSDLLQIVGALIHQYEERNSEIQRVSPQETLRFLMEQHGLRQADLKGELGSQGVVSEILSGKREINARQAKALAARFGVSPAVFI